MVGAQDRPPSPCLPENHSRRYLASPLPLPATRCRASKLDSFKEVIAELLAQDPSASAVVIAQRLQPLGYSGELTILRDYLRSWRRRQPPQRAYVRVESSPGDCFQVDWGHFGALDYQGDKRKLYAFCLVECHSRRLYLEFTHSQSFETFLRCHQHAFHCMGGVARQILFDFVPGNKIEILWRSSLCALWRSIGHCCRRWTF